jgi:hypothetical protein
MTRSDDEQLWDLLDRARQPEVSPFFARDIVRKVREDESAKAGWTTWLGWRHLVPATGFAALVAAAVVLMHHPRLDRDANPADADPIAQIDPQDYDVVADLDVLLASEENNLWDDNSSL